MSLHEPTLPKCNPKDQKSPIVKLFLSVLYTVLAMAAAAAILLAASLFILAVGVTGVIVTMIIFVFFAITFIFYEGM